MNRFHSITLDRRGVGSGGGARERQLCQCQVNQDQSPSRTDLYRESRVVLGLNWVLPSGAVHSGRLIITLSRLSGRCVLLSKTLVVATAYMNSRAAL